MYVRDGYEGDSEAVNVLASSIDLSLSYRTDTDYTDSRTIYFTMLNGCTGKYVRLKPTPSRFSNAL